MFRSKILLFIFFSTASRKHLDERIFLQCIIMDAADVIDLTEEGDAPASVAADFPDFDAAQATARRLRWSFPFLPDAALHHLNTLPPAFLGLLLSSTVELRDLLATAGEPASSPAGWRRWRSTCSGQPAARPRRRRRTPTRARTRARTRRMMTWTPRLRSRGICKQSTTRPLRGWTRRSRAAATTTRASPQQEARPPRPACKAQASSAGAGRRARRGRRGVRPPPRRRRSAPTTTR